MNTSTNSQYVYLCDDTPEGILTGVYDAWASHHGHSNNRLMTANAEFNQELFCEYITVKTNLDKARKVSNSLKKKISRGFGEWILHCMSSCDEDKADCIYRAIILGFHKGPQIMQALTIPAIERLFEMDRHISNEFCHYRGFLRFTELQNGLLLGKFRPKNDIILDIAEHFTDRFPNEDFIIADTGRNSLFLHSHTLENSYFSHVDFQVDDIDTPYSQDEKRLQSLWSTYIDTIEIEARENLKLQQNMLPLRFREYMNEFHSYQE